MSNKYIFHKTGIVRGEAKYQNSKFTRVFAALYMFTAVFINMKQPYFQILTY